MKNNAGPSVPLTRSGRVRFGCLAGTRGASLDSSYYRTITWPRLREVLMGKSTSPRRENHIWYPKKPIVDTRILSYVRTGCKVSGNLFTSAQILFTLFEFPADT